MTSREFALEIDREFAELMGGVHRAVEFLGIEAVKRVVMKSPVDKGQFRGSWTATIGAVDTSTPGTFDTTGSPTIARAVGSLAAYSAVEGFPSIYLQSNVVHAQPLEDGHSGQAPGGVVGITVAELAAIWEQQKL